MRILKNDNLATPHCLDSSCRKNHIARNYRVHHGAGWNTKPVRGGEAVNRQDGNTNNDSADSSQNYDEGFSKSHTDRSCFNRFP